MTYYAFNQLSSTLKSMEGINSDERYFEGLLTVQMKDKQGEVTIVDELYKVLPVWIDRGAPISDTHSNRIVGKGINYSRTTVKSDDGAILPAIKITGKIFKNYELDNVIWNKIKNNEYKGLSFGGATRSARSPIKMKDGSTAYALSDLEHYEVAVCADPAVPMAIITDFNHIAKANFDSTVRDDGKMVIQCSKMGCYVNSTKSDLLTVMEGDKAENYKTVEAGKQRGQPIDIPVTKKVLDNGKLRENDDFADPDKSLLLDTDEGKKKADPKACPNCKKTQKQMEGMVSMNNACPNCGHGFKDKMMEKKEMLEAVIGNPNEKKPTQPVSGERKEVTSGYELEKAIELVNKAGYQVYTEDRNNGTGINDLQREIPEECNPLRTSQQLPMDIQQANLNESQTFEQKVQALIAEGKSRESAEKIVGSFVHKVEASSGSGGAGIGDGNNVNGGTMTTQTGGANNPVHNNGCDCTCKDCKRNDKCDCCEKCKKKSRGLDISNTGSGGTTEQAFNQNPPNAQRLNNKADDGEEEPPDSVPDEVELTEGGQKVHDDAARYVRSQHYIKSTMRVNKVHALLVLNKVRDKGAFGQTKVEKPINAHVGNLSQPFGRKTQGNKEMEKRQRKSRARMFHTSHGDGETELSRKLPTNKLPPLPKTEKVPYKKYRKRDLEKSLSELKKLKGRNPMGLKGNRGYNTRLYEDPETHHVGIHDNKTEDIHEISGTGSNYNNEISQDTSPAHSTKPKGTILDPIKRALTELKKLHMSGGLGSRGLGAGATYTQGQRDSTQITLVQPRPTDDRVEAKCIPTDDDFKNLKMSLDKLTKVRRNEGKFGSDVGGTGSTSTAVADENTKFMDVNGNSHSTSEEAQAVPARKRMNRRLSRQRAADYKADTRSTIGDRLKE